MQEKAKTTKTTEKTQEKAETKMPGKGTGKAIALVILAVLVGLALLAPQALKLLGNSDKALQADTLPEASEFTPATSDSAIYAALAENGVEGALVEIGEGKTIVSLTVPAGADARKTAFLALGAAGALSPASNTVIVEAIDGTNRKTYSASASDVQALAEGRLTEAEFEARVTQI